MELNDVQVNSFFFDFLKKRLFGLAARNRLSLLPLSFSSSSNVLSFSIQKRRLLVSRRLMASKISVLGEPKRVNLVVRALKPYYIPLDIFLHFRSETCTQWTTEAARVRCIIGHTLLKIVRWCIRLTR